MYGTKSLGNATYEGVRTVEESTTSVGLSVYGMEILGNATYERVVRTGRTNGSYERVVRTGRTNGSYERLKRALPVWGFPCMARKF